MSNVNHTQQYLQPPKVDKTIKEARPPGGYTSYNTELKDASRKKALSETEDKLTHEQEKVKEKEQELDKLPSQLSDNTQQLGNLQRQSQKSRLCCSQECEQLQSKNQHLHDTGELSKAVTQQLTDVREQLQIEKRERTVLQGEISKLQGKLKAKDQEIDELEQTLKAAQKEINELQREEKPDWVIPRDQIQLTDSSLGKGSWGFVIEGRYCGCAVAVKKMHDLILSPHNISLFEREMKIASRCRHPCLLQFIGATNDFDSPLFVTELLEKSLRVLLNERSLRRDEIFVISLDIARALNYLHQKEPSPIIHRDISSANVLLWQQGNQWRAKVSDYGTANFIEQIMTANPGALIYSAPEVSTKNQTDKIDVYSFGVLLCEMCIRELPNPQARTQQVIKVTYSELRPLIRQSLHDDPNSRPSMEMIIDHLEQDV